MHGISVLSVGMYRESPGKIMGIGIMEKKIEITVVYWSCIGKWKTNMETIILYWTYIGVM